jgi:hypothetical protein
MKIIIDLSEPVPMGGYAMECAVVDYFKELGYSDFNVTVEHDDYEH